MDPPGPEAADLPRCTKKGQIDACLQVSDAGLPWPANMTNAEPGCIARLECSLTERLHRNTFPVLGDPLRPETHVQIQGLAIVAMNMAISTLRPHLWKALDMQILAPLIR